MAQSRSSARRHRLTTLLVATALVSGCQGGAPFLAAGKPGEAEGRISTDAWGNVSIAVGGRSFRIKAADLRPIADVSIQAGSTFYTLRDGRFAMPEAALRNIKENSRAFFRVFVSGYTPKQVWIGQAGDDVVLSPMRTMAVALGMGPLGGELKAKDGSVAVGVPGGMLEKPGTKVALSTYQPEITPEETETAVAARNDFLAKVKAKSANGYALAQNAGACEGADDPLPCPPPTESLGLMLTVDGPLQPGQMTATMDLGVYLRGWDGNGQPPWVANPGDWTPEQAAQARAADKLLRTYERMAKHANGSAYQDVMASDFGVRVEGSKLFFTVSVGVDDTVDGFVRTDVEGVSLLGVKVEFTAVSSLNAALPPSALPPAMLGAAAPAAGTAPRLATDAAGLIGLDGASLVGMDAASLIGLDGGSLVGQQSATLIGLDGASLVGMDGGSLIGLDGASLIGLDGASLIGSDGASLIGNDGGSLVGGVQVPFAPSAAKYGLQAYTEYVWGGGTVRALDWDGTTAYSAPIPVQGDGSYAMHGLPATKPFFLIEATVDTYKLYGLAIAPGKKLTSVRLDAATTVVTAAIWDAVRKGTLAPGQINLARYNALVAKAKAALTQAQAQAAVKPATAAGVWPLQPALDVAGLLGLVLNLVTTLLGSLAGAAAVPVAAGSISAIVSGIDKPFSVLPVGPNVFVVARESGYTMLINESSGSTVGPPMFSFQENAEFRGMATDGTVVYAADYKNFRIVRKNKNDASFGTVATFGTEKPSGLARAADGTLYVTLDNLNQIWKVPPSGIPEVLAGTGVSGFAPGFRTSATFNKPVGLALDPAGTTLWVADSHNHAIRKLDLATGTVTNVAGGNGQAHPGDGAAAAAKFDTPMGLTVAPNGTVYVADWNNHVIRYITADGATVGTLAGTPGNSGNGPNQLNKPAGLAYVEGPGANLDYLLVADYDNGAIRKIKIQ